jgi:Ribbon-helix-helix protein, copG family
MTRRAKIKAVLYLYADQVATLKKRAEALDESMSTLIRRAIDAYLKIKPTKR